MRAEASRFGCAAAGVTCHSRSGPTWTHRSFPPTGCSHSRTRTQQQPPNRQRQRSIDDTWRDSFLLSDLFSLKLALPTNPAGPGEATGSTQAFVDTAAYVSPAGNVNFSPQPGHIPLLPTLAALYARRFPQPGQFMCSVLARLHRRQTRKPTATALATTIAMTTHCE